MEGSIIRAAIRLAAYVALTLPLMPVQAALVWAGRWSGVASRLAGRLPLAYHRLCCRIFGVTVERRGAPGADRPLLIVANHVSYFDIVVLSACLETSFVAKREIANWPFFGWLAKLQRTVFVGRRTRGVAGERDDVARHLAQGLNLVLFPEGTSSDGTHVLPFKSSLFGVAEVRGGKPLVVQPASIAYLRLDGMPIGRQWRPFFAWYGEMDLAPHLWRLIGLGRLTVAVEFHAPLTLEQCGSRKALSAACERAVARGLAAAHAGWRPPPPAPDRAVGVAGPPIGAVP